MFRSLQTPSFLALAPTGMIQAMDADRCSARGSAPCPHIHEKHVSPIFDKLQLPSTKDIHRRVLAVLALLRN